jgi:hypothetical protein
MNPTRRAVLLGIPGVVAAPAIVRASSIMKIRPFAEFPVTVETPFDETLWRELARRMRLRDAGVSPIWFC